MRSTKKTLLPVAVILAITALMSCVQEDQIGESDTTPAEVEVVESGGSGTQEPIRIGISMPSATHGYLARCIYHTERAIADWEQKDADVEFVLVTADNVNKQANDIQDLVITGIDALVVFPFDTTLTSTIREVFNSGTYVVVLDRGVTDSSYNIWLTIDSYEYARVGMEFLCRQLEYNGRVVNIEGIPSSHTTDRNQAINDVAAKYPGITVIDSQPADWNRQKALAVMENYLQRYDRIDGLITTDDDMLIGALQAYEESGRDDVRAAIGGAGDKNIIRMIMDDSHPLIKGNMSFPPSQCATAVSLAVMGVRGVPLNNFYQQVLPKRIVLSSALITRENAQDHYFPDEP